ncbi:hypothetical protein K445DRAFT_130458 [Daldinia sp. EC12]|nr:hypothetical protein K445DRAFT_130458 [Daldinia sp. EC12]
MVTIAVVRLAAIARVATAMITATVAPLVATTTTIAGIDPRRVVDPLMITHLHVDATKIRTVATTDPRRIRMSTADPMTDLRGTSPRVRVAMGLARAGVTPERITAEVAVTGKFLESTLFERPPLRYLDTAPFLRVWPGLCTVPVICL